MIKWARIVIITIFLIIGAIFAYVKVTGRMDSDLIPPVITAETDELTVPVDATDEDLMQGMQATDNRDGDVTASMMVVSRSKFIRPGVCTVKYVAFDRHNNVASYTRRVTYEGYHSPEYHLEVPLIYPMSERNADYLESIHAEDLLDGDITSLIRMSSGVQTVQEDNSVEIPLTLEVVNSSGDASVIEIAVRYLDEATYRLEAPSLTDYIVYTEVGNPVDAMSYLNGIRIGKETKLFSISGYSEADIVADTSNVDYSTPGVYWIQYTLYHRVESERTPEEETVEETTSEETTEELFPMGTTDLYVVVREAV